MSRGHDADAQFKADLLAIREYFMAQLREDGEDGDSDEWEDVASDEDWDDDDDFDDEDDDLDEEDEEDDVPPPREEPRYTAVQFDPSIHDLYLTGRGGLGGLGLRTRGRDPDEQFDYTGYEHATPFRAAPVPVKWRFLRPFLDRLETPLFSIHDATRTHTDPVRVGRDADDWGLAVAYRTAENAIRRTAHYHSVQASMLLHAILARVDYDGFLSLVIRRSRMDVPAILNLTTPVDRVVPVFHFRFDGGESRCLDHSWYTLMNLFGYPDDNDVFSEHFATLMNTVYDDPSLEDGWKKRLLAPVPVKFTFAPDRYELRDQADTINSFTQTLTRIRSIEDEWIAHHRTVEMRPDDVVAPVFRVESIELDLRKFTLCTPVLVALFKLLNTGVHVSSLTLPETAVDETGNVQNRRLLWAVLVKSILGTRLSPVKTSSVDRLVLPSLYMTNEYFAPLAAVLRDSIVLKSLRIELPMNTRMLPDHVPNVWSWLGYALFSRDSRSSLETLEIVSDQLSSKALDAFSLQCESLDPLGSLWEAVTNIHSGSNNSARDSTGRYMYIHLSKGTRLRVVGQASVPSLAVPSSCLGQIVLNDSTSPMLGLLVPGFGFCFVERAAVRDRKCGHIAVPNHPTSINTVIVDAKDCGRNDISTSEFVSRVLELVGARLKSLALKGDPIDESCVNALARFCPKLESLRLDGAALPTFNSLITTYERGVGARPSSLDLRNIETSTSAVDDLLSRLATPGHNMEQRLRRVAIGNGWSNTIDASIADRLTHVLEKNRFMTHLIVHDVVAQLWNPDEGKHNGAIVAEPQVSLESRIALLSAVKRTATTWAPSTSPVSMFTPDLFTLIFAFAANTTHRTVLRVPNQDNRF